MAAGEVARLYVKIIGDISDFKRSIENTKATFRSLGQNIRAGAKAIGDIGSTLTKSVTVPLTAAGYAAIRTFNEIDNGLDTVIKKTGATGKTAKELERSFFNVAKSTYASFDEVGAAIGEINTRFGFTGKLLEETSKKFIAFAKVNEIDVSNSIRIVSRVMGDWSLKTTEVSRVLDILTKASQVTGISISTLGEKVVFYGVQLRYLGFSLEEAIALLSKWEKEGVATEKILGIVSNALAKLAKTSKDPVKAFWDLVKRIKEAKTEQQALTIAAKHFSARGAADLAKAIREGRFDVEAFVSALKNAKGTVEATEKGVVDFSEKFQKTMNELKVALYPLAETLVKTLEKVIPILNKFIKESVVPLIEAFNRLSPATQETILKFVALAAAVGPALNAISFVVLSISGLIANLGKLTAAIKAVFVLAKANPWVAALTMLVPLVVSVIVKFIQLKRQGVDTFTAIGMAIKLVVNQIPLIGSVVEKIGVHFAVAFNQMKAAATELINEVIKLINRFIAAWNASPLGNLKKFKPLKLIGEPAKKIVKPIGGVTALQTGGIVKHPTLALIGERKPEAVIPLDKLNQLIGPQKITVEVRPAPGFERFIEVKIKQFKERDARR
jgi:TP901 family phage tail tape measure protein